MHATRRLIAPDSLPRLRAGAGACLAALALSACSTLGLEEARLPEAPATTSAAPVEIAALQAEVKRLKAENTQLEKKLADLQRRKPDLRASAETPTLEQPPAAAPAASEAPQASASVPTLKPEAVVTTAEADTALRNAPAKPVEPSPRLVAPTFASEEETIFENEAGGAVKTQSVLYGVHLASYRHEEEARTGWAKLQRDNPDELGLLEPRLESVTIEGRGEFLRLIGGGFSAAEKAAALCQRLEAKDVYCAVTSFKGEPLSVAQLR